MKKLLMASALAAGFAFAAPAPVDAHSPNVRIYLGIPHYGYRLGPDYQYRRGHGWYRPSAGRISCNRAPTLIRNQGYRNVQAIECRGPSYTFRSTRNGKRFVVDVNSRSGGVWRG